MEFVSDEKLNAIVVALKQQFRPTRVLLYRSRANGTNRRDSDYDFVLVVPKFDAKNRYDVMSEIASKFFREFDAEVQVWIYSEEDFEDWKDEFSSIPETALNTGREIDLG